VDKCLDGIWNGDHLSVGSVREESMGGSLLEINQIQMHYVVVDPGGELGNLRFLMMLSEGCGRGSFRLCSINAPLRLANPMRKL